MRTQKRDFLKN